MIIGASSFALPLPPRDFEKHLDSLRREVEAIELYIPKLEIYKNTSLLMGRVENLVDTLSALTMKTSIHAPYFGDSPSYPPNLMVDTAHMSKAKLRLLEESIELASLFEAEIVVLHPGKIWGDKKASLSQMIRNLRSLPSLQRIGEFCLGSKTKRVLIPLTFAVMQGSF